jgi:hypothetical protein
MAVTRIDRPQMWLWVLAIEIVIIAIAVLAIYWERHPAPAPPYVETPDEPGTMFVYNGTLNGCQLYHVRPAYGPDFHVTTCHHLANVFNAVPKKKNAWDYMLTTTEVQYWPEGN